MGWTQWLVIVVGGVVGVVGVIEVDRVVGWLFERVRVVGVVGVLTDKDVIFDIL